MPHSLYGQIGVFTTVLSCIFALVRGAQPERIAASAILVAEVLVLTLQDRINFLDPQRRFLAIDVALMTVFGALLTNYRRKWLLPATACQILSTTLHFAALWTPGVRAWAYVTLMALLGYGQLIVLVGGANGVSRAHEQAEEASAAARAARLCNDFGPERALHWVQHALPKAKGLERRQLVRLSQHIAKRVWDVPYRGDVATRMLNN